MSRTTPPTGAEIAEQARQIRLDRAKSVAATRAKDNVHVRFTPALFDKPKQQAEMEDGFVFGQAEIAFGQLQTKLPPGKYNVFVAKVNDAWHAYAEFNGQLAGEATKVEVQQGTEQDAQAKPRLEFGTICVWQCVPWYMEFDVMLYNCYWVCWDLLAPWF